MCQSYLSIALFTDHLPSRSDTIPKPRNTLFLLEGPSFTGYPRKDTPKGLPFRLKDYLELVDWTLRWTPSHPAAMSQT